MGSRSKLDQGLGLIVTSRDTGEHKGKMMERELGLVGEL